jgi:hypothetical protein
MELWKLASLSIGLAGLLGGLYLLLQIAKVFRKNSHNQQAVQPPQQQTGQLPSRELTSGERSTEFWKIEIRLAVKEGLEEEFKIRGPIMAEADMRRVMKEVIGDWLDARLSKPLTRDST